MKKKAMHDDTMNAVMNNTMNAAMNNTMNNVMNNTMNCGVYGLTGSYRMVKLDFLLMKSQLISYLSLVVILLIFSLMGSSVIWLGVNGAWYMALMSINVFAVQEKNNLERFYGSLSIRWKDIILGRYFSIVLSFMAAFVLVMAVHFGFSLVKNSPLHLSDIPLSFSLSFALFTAIVSVEIPMIFRMGYTKARAWALLPYIFFIALLFVPYYLATWFGVIDFPSITAALSAVMAFIHQSAVRRVVPVISGLVAGCAMLYLSYHITVALYRRTR